MALQRFGKYTLLHRLAVGGMAEIFVARQRGMRGFSRKIVIKRIRSHLTKEQAFINMFLNEAKLAAQLNHSNIGQIFDLGKIGESFFIAMEYVRGRDLRTVVAKARSKDIPFPLEYSLKVASEVCEGLYYAHRKVDDSGAPLNIVHRDVTPENIMVSFDGEVKILDFGIAKAENLVSETRVGEIKGKLGYMSPEQAMGKSLDQRSDLFSLGVVLYEWVTGHKLFTAGNEVDVLRSVVDGKIYPPSYFRDDVPPPVEALVMRALERNRESRFQTAWDMQYEINQFLAHCDFYPSNIHLSNFLRQIFADDIRAEDENLVRADAEPDEDEPDSEGEATASHRAFDPAVGTGGREGTGRRKGTGRHRKTPTAGQQPAAEPDMLTAELLAAQDGHLSVTVEIARQEYGRLREIAERNGLSVPALIREVLDSFTRFR